ncbi:hypothetical protein GCM10025857_15380 [Alicyclobacillus contaminans]|uniref:hypothetical protein n=1 Tax=Alicyclobacillus contaminans TaxID=392016 RepID=UPI00047D84CA|nr:hypothetical protein [Alicyclobacillus contaminans]GMA50181.1 hypothetical protein GCM10025857_15380 [Alicyclobacillus contaminans]
MDKLEAVTNIVTALIGQGSLVIGKHTSDEDIKTLCKAFTEIYKTIGECEGSQVTFVDDL